MSESPEVIEAYRDYEPPVDVRRTVLRLIQHVEKRQLHGVRSIVLTNLDALSRQARRRKSKSRGRKVGLDQIAARYHPAWNNEPAWIELFVDQIFRDSPRWVLRVPLVRDVLLADTLFHEIGHHIHATQAPAHREKEDVADAWSLRLRRQFFGRAYWYLVPVVIALSPLYRLARRLHARRGRAAR